MSHILLGVTGSVAATLTRKLVVALDNLGEVRIIATTPSLYFWDTTNVAVPIWTDGEEWPGVTYRKNQEVPHIALGDWADLLVIAPLTANTINKMAVGVADNLLTCLFYAWPRTKPVVLAPAMNTRMWENQMTQRHLADLTYLPQPLKIVPPVEKNLACGTVGMGAMADIEDIVDAVRKSLK